MADIRVFRIQVAPRPCFEVKDWALADAFDDFLSEVAELQFATEFVEPDGVFVARRFFPLEAVNQEEMRRLVDQFMTQHTQGH